MPTFCNRQKRCSTAFVEQCSVSAISSIDCPSYSKSTNAVRRSTASAVTAACTAAICSRRTVACDACTPAADSSAVSPPASAQALRESVGCRRHQRSRFLAWFAAMEKHHVENFAPAR